MAWHPWSESGAAVASEELAGQLFQQAQACRWKQQRGLVPTDEERQALDRFFAVHMALLRHWVAERHLVDADADDCLQEACTRILAGLAGFHSDGRTEGVYSWMKTIVGTQAAKIHRYREEHAMEPLGAEGDAALACRNAGPEAECEQHETQAAVRYVLELLQRRLPPLVFQVFYRRCIEEKTIEEIAAELKLEKGMARLLVLRTKRKFAKMYERMHRWGGVEEFSPPT
jgi:RNA polymerase sigma factor (sigma-70 family)